jgi:hypothetical protein
MAKDKRLKSPRNIVSNMKVLIKVLVESINNILKFIGIEYLK